MLSLPAEDDRAVAVVKAIQSGDVAGLRKQLDDHPELAQARIVDHQGVSRTLLHVVSDCPGHFPNGSQTVATLIAAGADVNAVADLSKSQGSAEMALHWAASSDDVDVLDALLDGGTDIEAPGAVFTGGSPMSDAVVFAQWRAARRLLDRGARTTLWQAAALGLLDAVRGQVSMLHKGEVDRYALPFEETARRWWTRSGRRLRTGPSLRTRCAKGTVEGYGGVSSTPP